MLINVDAPIKQKEILEALQNNTEKQYKYLGHPNNMPTQLQFEVEGDESLIPYTKAYIKKAVGSMVAFRVLENGKNW